jgi:hypothetical protein
VNAAYATGTNKLKELIRFADRAEAIVNNHFLKPRIPIPMAQVAQVSRIFLATENTEATEKKSQIENRQS